MKHKIYLQPKARVIEINETGIICGSGDDNSGLPTFNGDIRPDQDPIKNGNGDFEGDAPTYRTTLWD